ncbi:hypothetical protein [Streptosporangium sp. NPDC000509]|uniref:hypothetical protein n=1 Tax=Streptosporangium sp. NPDC000509 TaxID=3366186 RepID=UPI0036B8CDCE
MTRRTGVGAGEPPGAPRVDLVAAGVAGSPTAFLAVPVTGRAVAGPPAAPRLEPVARLR